MSKCTFGLRRVLTYTHNVISEISIIVLYISIFLEKKKKVHTFMPCAVCTKHDMQWWKEKVKQVFALLSFLCFFSARCLSLAPWQNYKKLTNTQFSIWSKFSLTENTWNMMTSNCHESICSIALHEGFPEHVSKS